MKHTATPVCLLLAVQILSFSFVSDAQRLLYSESSEILKGKAINNSSQSINAYYDPQLYGLKSMHTFNAGDFQLFSHGRPGELLLDGQWRDAKEIAAFIAPKIHHSPFTIHQLNIYGCEFAKGEKGMAAVKYLEEKLGVDVAASTNITGKNGDWILEQGNVDATSLFGNYNGNLQCTGGGIVGGTGMQDDYDGDGICNLVDIDDDNDGILDAIESPSCFSTLADAKNFAGATVTSNFAWGATHLLTAALDGNTSTYGTVTPAVTGILGKVLVDITFPLNNKVLVTDAAVSVGTTAIGGVWNLEGWNGTGWDLLSGSTSTFNTANTTVMLTNNNFPAVKYSRIRIVGVSGNTANNGQATEITVDYTNYNASEHPKAICSNDTDGDGKLDHMDLDSDADGCFDKYESSVTDATLNANAYTDSLTVAYHTTGDVGVNGFSNAIETTTIPESGVYNGTYTYMYATRPGYAKCKDYDVDGVNDMTDIDDDNDGVLDAVESPSCFYTAAEAATIVSVTSAFVPKVGNPAPTLDIPAMHNTLTGVSETSPFNFISGQLAPTATPIFTVEYPTAVTIANLTVTQTANGITSTGFGRLWGSNDGINYTQLTTVTNAISLSTASVVLPYTTITTPYKFYQVRASGTTATNSTTLNIGTANITEIAGNTVTVPATYNQSATPKPTCTNDTDGDGKLNQYDLDSDGDGCYDKYESSVIGATLNGSYTDSLAIPYHTVGDAGVNGFSNSLESVTSPESGIYKSIYTYSLATGKSHARCNKDTDGDGIQDADDIDDDNDGIVDAVESPACFYLETELAKADSINTTLAIGAGDKTMDLKDGVLTGGFNFTAQALAGATILQFSSAIPAKLSSIDIQMNATTTGTNGFGATGATAKVMAFDGTNWIDISNPLGANINSTTLGKISIPITNTTTAFSLYRIVGVGVANSNTNTIGELILKAPSPYIASKYPKPACTSDADADGILNHADLDSDNDGCSDLKETKVSPTTDISGYNPAATNALGGSWGFSGAPIAGSQLNPAATDANNDGLNDSVDPNTDGTADYTPTYDPYAISSGLVVCVDTDKDGIPDVEDIDDDNDGVLDSVENLCGSTYSTVPNTVVNGNFTNGTSGFYTELDSYDNVFADPSYATFNGINGYTATWNPYPANGTRGVDPTNNYISTNDIADVSGVNPVVVWRQTINLVANSNYVWQMDMTTSGVNLDFQLNGNSLVAGPKAYNSGSGYSNGTWKKAQIPFNSGVGGQVTLQILQYLNAGAGAGDMGIDNIEITSQCTYDVDSDADGVPNRLDLDSDNDGCFDKYEASVIGATVNGSYSDSLTVPYQTAGDVGTNGFSNSLETVTTPESGIYKSAYTYSLALGKHYTRCNKDSDNDGVPDVDDIDDDNDGIVDAIESPACFSAQADVTKIETINPVTLLIGGGDDVNDLIDGTLTGGFNFQNTQAITGVTLLEFTSAFPVKFNTVDIQMNATTTGATNGFGAAGALAKVMALDGTNWIDISNPSGTGIAATTLGKISIPVTNNTSFSKYRIVGVSGNTSNNALGEILLTTPSPFVASRYPKLTCSSDVDGDGILNHLDLDSDNDGCSDLKETKVSPTTDITGYNPAANNAVGVSWGFSGAAITGSQLNPAATDANNDGLNDSVDPDTNGSTNYVQSNPTEYLFFALNAAKTFCLDTDRDGVPDVEDIDDDNDGVLDTQESGTCSSTPDGLTNYFYFKVTGPNTLGHDLVPMSGMGGATPINVWPQVDEYGMPTNTTATILQSGTVSGLDEPANTDQSANYVIDALRYNGWVNFPSNLWYTNIKVRTNHYLNGASNVSGGAWVISSNESPANWIDPVDPATSTPLLDMGNTHPITNPDGGWNLPPIGYTDYTSVAPRNTPDAFIVNLEVSPTSHYISEWQVDPYSLWEGHFLQYSTDGGTTWVTIPNSWYSSKPPCSSVDIDTDGDGVPNRLDLDSDDDGCSDATESGVSAYSGLTAHITTSGNNGTYCGGTVPGMLNAYFGIGTPAQYGSNGFFNELESLTTGVYDSTYSYNFAIASNYSVCKSGDADGDGVYDVDDEDDDNDGIFDAVESPSCFYTATEWNTGAIPEYAVTISSVLNNTLGKFSQLTDDIDNVNAVSFVTGQLATDNSVYLFNFVHPVRLDALYIKFATNASQFTGNTKLQGSTTGLAGSWVDITGPTGNSTGSHTTVNGSYSLTNAIKYTATGANAVNKYKYIRITGLNSVNVNANNAVEVYFDLNLASYDASYYPKLSCDVDDDGDDIPNHHDLDSDGDGCSDAVETNISGVLLPGYMINNSGLIYSPKAIVEGLYGDNGFADPLEDPDESGVYTGNYNDYTKAKDKDIHDCAVMPILLPDVNATYLGVEVTGSVKNNDVVPANSSYGDPVEVAGYDNPGNEVPEIDPATGAYTFTADTAGIYKFYVTVCPPTVTENCPVELLTITVLDKNTDDNKPVLAPDFATTKKNVPVTLMTLGNDRSGNINLALDTASLSISTDPKHGTATIDAETGNITYTPAIGFVGVDTLYYNVCDKKTPTANCAITMQIITILPTTATNSVQAADDYAYVPNTGPATGNVILNDNDPDGNLMSVSPYTDSTATGKFVLNADGTYEFTPGSEFTGPVNFTYYVCDNASPTPACKTATIYFVIYSQLGVSLPVTLLDLKATAIDNKYVQLRWKTASEINNDHFVIERSSGNGQWEEIGKVNGAGNSSQVINYSFIDSDPYTGRSYYRLRQVDLDGKTAYSPVRTVSISVMKPTLKAYPQPARETVMIEGDMNSKASIVIIDIVGRNMTSYITVVSRSADKLLINVSRLLPGVYLMRIGDSQVKIVKQ